MITDREYALLAGAAYTSTRSETNRIPWPEPQGWTPYLPPSLLNKLAEMGFEILGGTILDRSSGFEARVFSDGLQTVIAYAGTYPPDVLGDHITNGALAAGIYTDQLERAALLYAAVKQAGAPDITFTGHSLGGGLAALMGVYFDKRAVTFDQAPFFRAAFFDHHVRLQTALTSQGFGADADLAGFFVQVTLGGDQIRGAGKVSSINVEGEFLSVSPFTLFRRIGIPRLINLDDTAVAKTDRFDLHAQSLLILTDHSASFRQRIADVQSLLPSLFDDHFFDGDARRDKPVLLEHFIRHEFGVPETTYASGDGMFRTFVDELLVLSQTGVMQQAVVSRPGPSEKLFQHAMNLVLQQGYYSISDRFDPTRTIFKPAVGGWYFDTADATGGGTASDLLAREILAEAIGGMYAGGTALYSSLTLRNFDRLYWQSGEGALNATGADAKSDLMLGGAFGDVMSGAAGRDLLLGGEGADTLDGGTGDDTLIGGEGFDTYIVGNGKDTIRDGTTGEGVIRTESGIILAGGKGAGKRNTWTGTNGEIYTFAPIRTAQMGILTIANLGTGKEVTIEDFDFARAQANGYLGIKLDPAAKIVIEEAGGTTPFGPFAFDPAGVTGVSTIAEGAGRAYTIYLNVAASAGDTLTLALAGLGDGFQAVLGSTTVPADGAVITLVEGQTQVSFGLVQTGEVTADVSGSLSASYTSQNGTATSNLWSVGITDAGDTTKVLDGDQSYATYTAPGDIRRDGRIVVSGGETAYVIGADGNLVPGAGITLADNTLYGSEANDRINGLTGNDALNGGAGNDQLYGGEGDDLLAGGAGSNKLDGGAGNDFILGAGDLSGWLQQFGPNDTWQAPLGKLVYGHGTTWGVYRDSDILTIWDGAANAGTGADANAIDAGDGDDHVIAGAGDDRIQGGPGDDWLDGAAGADLIEGGDGNDRIQADGVVKEGYLNTVAAENHGADFADGGAGDDDIVGGGNADALFGGGGADRIFGDRGGRTDDEFFVKLAAHGADYLDGEDGDDYLEGGGDDDTIYGGPGNDILWGDTTADNIVGNDAGQSAADLHALAWGNDYLDGGDGHDDIVGGGKDDALYGGLGNDRLWGDEGNAALPGEYHGVDYLDGGDGDDVLVGGGNDDTLYGGAGADQLLGDDNQDKLAGAFHGNDYLDGGAGNDLLIGGGGDDMLFGGDGDDMLVGDGSGTGDPAADFHGYDYLEGGDGNDVLAGGGKGDTLIGGQGNDYLDGGTDADYMAGGAGDDTYVVDDAGDVVVEAAGDGIDSVISSIGIFLPDNVERLTLTGTDATDATGNDDDNTLIGNDGANRLVGRDGNDTLIGGGGADTLVGGTGDDYYEVDDAGDTIVEHAGQGDDFVRTMLSYTLAENVERLAADGTGDLALTGNALANSLFGNAGNNTLAGGAGNDYLVGGAGDDVYVFNRGDGQDAIDSTDLPGATDTLRFGTGITDADVVAFRSGNDVIVKLKGANDLVSVLRHYDGSTADGGAISDHRIDRVEFSNGVTWDQAMIQAAVDRAASNRAPTVMSYLPTLQARAGDAFTYTVPAGTIADPDAGDSIVYSVTMQDGSAMPAWLAFDAATRTFTGTPEAGDVGSVQFVLWGADDYGVASGEHVILNVAGPNRAPVLATALPDQTAWQGGVFTYTLPAAAFADPDEGDALGYSATLPDGSALPSWLAFDPATRSFSGTPSGAGTVSVRVTARDPGNLTASDVFDITVANGMMVTGTDAGEVLQGSPGDDTLSGLGGGDTLWGRAGNDRLDGGVGDDTLIGDGGADTYIFGEGYGQDRIFGGSNFDDDPDLGIHDVIAFSDDVAVSETQARRDRSNNLILTITPTGDQLTVMGYFNADPAVSNFVGQIRFGDGTVWDPAAVRQLVSVPTDGPDNLYGTDGSDTLDGGAGDDYLEGGAGADTYRFGRGYGSDIILDHDAIGASAIDVIQFAAGVSASDVTATCLGGGHLVLTITSSGDQLMVGDYFIEYPDWGVNGRVEEIRFADGTVWDVATVEALVTVGTAGDDRLYGFDSDDVLDGGPGNDYVSGGGGNDTLHGGAGDDIVYGEGGDDILDGGPGDDYLDGNSGNDTYVFGKGSGQDRLFNSDYDTDTVDAIQFASNVTVAEVAATRSGFSLILTIPGTGDSLYVRDYFRINGGYRWNEVEQIRFADGTVWSTADIDRITSSVTLTGTSGADTLSGGDGDDTLNGLAGNDVLYGNDGNDRLDGGAGSDTMAGGAGDDLYLVDSSADLVRESPDEGTDSVQSSVTHTLAANVENLTLTGTSAINGTGNALANLLTGNSANNALAGGAGNDRLDGRGGADKMAGGTGDDTYVVDNGRDAIMESASAGIDTVQSSVTYTLATNVENLVLTGTAAINGTGNALANVLTGNSAANTLSGGTGADTLIGAAGDDIYVVDNALDVVTENADEGIDMVQSSVTHALGANVEALGLTGTKAINGTGNALDNLLRGNSANNALNGGDGIDILEGGAGNDTLTDAAGAALFNGGAGADLLMGGAGSQIFLGGKGNDTLTTGTGDDLLLFNKGDGQDTLAAGESGQDTLSLGGGVRYTDLSFVKSSNDLVLKLGSTDQITFKDWYAATPSRSVVNLQVIAEAMSDFAAGGSDPLRDDKVERFDFGGLVGAFDAARAANASLTGWALTSALASYQLAGSDSAAIGGDLAYQYGRNGTLAGIGLMPALNVLADPAFGSSAQPLTPLAGLQIGSQRLS